MPSVQNRSCTLRLYSAILALINYSYRQRSSFPSKEKAGHASPIAEFAFYFSWRALSTEIFMSGSNLTCTLPQKFHLAKNTLHDADFHFHLRVLKKDKGNDMTLVSQFPLNQHRSIMRRNVNTNFLKLDLLSSACEQLAYFSRTAA